MYDISDGNPVHVSWAFSSSAGLTSHSPRPVNDAPPPHAPPVFECAPAAAPRRSRSRSTALPSSGGCAPRGSCPATGSGPTSSTWPRGATRPRTPRGSGTAPGACSPPPPALLTSSRCPSGSAAAPVWVSGAGWRGA